MSFQAIRIFLGLKYPNLLRFENFEIPSWVQIFRTEPKGTNLYPTPKFDAHVYSLPLYFINNILFVSQKSEHGT